MRILLAAFAAGGLFAAAPAQCSALANQPPGTDLRLGDDEIRVVGLGFPFTFNGATFTTVTICSNGFLWLGSVGDAAFDGRSTAFQPIENDFLALGPRIAPCWHDWDPSAGGAVYFTTDGSSAAIVWKNVPSFAAATVVADMEVVFAQSGNVYLHYGAGMAAPPTSAITGITAGGGTGPNRLTWTTFLPGTVATCTGYQVFSTGAFNLGGAWVELMPTDPQSMNFLGANAAALPTCAPPAQLPLASDVTSFGTGCPLAQALQPSAIYEAFTASGGGHETDLAGTSVLFVRAGTTYVAQPGPAFDTSYLAQAQPLRLPDESVTALSVGAMGSFEFGGIAVDVLHVADNGYIDLQDGIGPDYTPTVAEMLGQTGEGARIAPHWTDYDMSPGLPGTFWWSNNDPNFCMATWDGVRLYGQTLTATFQVKLFANGDIAFAYGALSAGNVPVLAGLSLGNGAADPGPTDLSALAGGNVTRDLGTLVQPLRHSTAGRAAINTGFVLQADNVPLTSVIGMFAFGGGQTAVDLTPIGMPGCNQLVSLDVVYTLVLGGQTHMQLGLQVPPLPAFLGVTLHTQAAVLAPLNPFGAITSNGLSWTIGL